MRHKFIVIDDENSPIALLVDYLRAAFKGSSVAHDKTCATWSAAEEIVRSFPDEPKYVAFFDLSLEGAKGENAIAALEQISALRVQRRKWTFIAYSRFMETVEDAPDLDEIFDGRISRQRLTPMDRTERIDYVKKAVLDALAHRKGIAPIPDDADIVDSFGMRVFRAAFGDKTTAEKAIAELLNAETADWPTPRVEALTSGHSGAHLIQLSSGRESLVVKIARFPSIIDHEIHAVSRNLSRLGAFAMKLAQFDTEKKPLPGGGVYYRQARVFGRSLLSHATLDRQRHGFRHRSIVPEALHFLEAAPVSLRRLFVICASTFLLGHGGVFSSGRCRRCYEMMTTHRSVASPNFPTQRNLKGWALACSSSEQTTTPCDP